MIWFTTHSLACRSQILFSRGGSQIHGRTRLSVRLLTWMTTIWKKSRCTPISETRGIDEKGVRVRLPMMIEAAGVNASAALGGILPHSVSSFVTFYVNICQHFYQPTKEECRLSE